MINGLYLVIILVVAAFSAIIGFRKGITRQLSSLLGVAFGAVAARILAPGLAVQFTGLVSSHFDSRFVGFVSGLLAAVVIYLIVYAVFSIFTKVLRGALSVFEVGMFNRLLGSFFCIFKNLLWVSIFYNLLLCYNPDCGLLRYARSDDGNMVGGVMWLTSAVLGCGGAHELGHLIQLQEAASISCNFNCPADVINIG